MLLGDVSVADSTASAVNEVTVSVRQPGEVAEKFHAFGFVDVGHGFPPVLSGGVKSAGDRQGLANWGRFT